MYGFSAGGFSLRVVSSLRTAVVAALWSTKRRSGCREIVLTLFLTECSMSESETVEAWLTRGLHGA